MTVIQIVGPRVWDVLRSGALDIDSDGRVRIGLAIDDKPYGCTRVEASWAPSGDPRILFHVEPLSS